ncbi:MAG: lipid A export permease/ATP-binding protein MsbA [Halofilum sp. (in: g-proteobacteria)]
MAQTGEYPSAVETYRRLLFYLRQHWGPFVIALVGLIGYGGTDAAFAALMKPMLDSGFVDKDPDNIRLVALGLVGVFALRGLSGFMSNYLMEWVGWRIITRMRQQMFAKILEMPTSVFDTTPSGELISKLTFNVQRVAQAATNAVTILVRDTFTVLFLVAWMAYLNFWMTLGALVVTPFLGFIFRYITQRFRRVSRRIQNQMGDVTHVIEEAVEANRVIKIFGGRDYEADQFGRMNERMRRFQMKMAYTKAASVPLIQFLLAIVLAAVVYAASMPSVVQANSVGSFVSFFTALMMVFPPMKRLTNVNAQIQKGIAAGESVFDLLDRDGERDTGTQTLDRARGDVRYEEVNFAYRPEKGTVLADVNLEIRAGETVALVGRSGSGKTTLANLLPRLYELRSGRILLDGIDIRDLTLDSLRAQIAYVGQTVTLFNDTIANNIAYGRLGGATREQIEQAARDAHAADFIEQLPEGYDTQVGEDGIMLSGGQRQRLAIARALLKDAPVLILDEATSALDTESERAVQAGLERLVHNRTTLVIAHRLSTIEGADRIVVMDGGQVREQGTHAELLARNGAYANLYRMQFGEAATGGG